jgi:hypothetical protein
MAGNKIYWWREWEVIMVRSALWKEWFDSVEKKIID